MRANPSWRNRVDFQAGKTHQTHGVSAHFLVRLYYQVWWWTMLYPRIDLLQVLILEIRRVFPSASSKQRTGTVKTPHNSFQRKTTVMDCRLPWKWGTVLIEQTESVQTQAILMERERKYTFFSLPPPFSFFSLSFSFFPLPIISHSTLITTYELPIFYILPTRKISQFLAGVVRLVKGCWNGNPGQIEVWCTTTGWTHLLVSPNSLLPYSSQEFDTHRIIEHNLALIMLLELLYRHEMDIWETKRGLMYFSCAICLRVYARIF